jgi:hypothetical protein
MVSLIRGGTASRLAVTFTGDVVRFTGDLEEEGRLAREGTPLEATFAV